MSFKRRAPQQVDKFLNDKQKQDMDDWLDKEFENLNIKPQIKVKQEKQDIKKALKNTDSKLILNDLDDIKQMELEAFGHVKPKLGNNQKNEIQKEITSKPILEKPFALRKKQSSRDLDQSTDLMQKIQIQNDYLESYQVPDKSKMITFKPKVEPVKPQIETKQKIDQIQEEAMRLTKTGAFNKPKINYKNDKFTQQMNEIKQKKKELEQIEKEYKDEFDEDVMQNVDQSQQSLQYLPEKKFDMMKPEQKLEQKTSVVASKPFDESKLSYKKPISLEKKSKQMVESQNIDQVDKQRESNKIQEIDQIQQINEQILKQAQQIISQPYEEDERKICLNTQGPKISDDKQQQQIKRVKDLKSMVKLQKEDFGNMLEILPIGKYEVFVNGIKSGIIKNQGDDSHEAYVNKDVQTELIQKSEFSNMCPDDKAKSLMQNDSKSEATNESLKYFEFVNKMGPIIEDILQKSLQIGSIMQNSKTVVIRKDQQVKMELPEYLKDLQYQINVIYSFTEEFNDDSINYTYIVFQLENQPKEINLSYTIEYKNHKINNYFVTQSKITALLRISYVLIAGTQDGCIIIWDLRYGMQQKQSHLIKKNFLKNIFFQSPQYSSYYLINDDINDSLHNSLVVQLSDNREKKQELLSMDEFGNIIIWNIIDLSQNEQTRTYLDYGIHSKIKLLMISKIDLCSKFQKQILAYNFCVDSKENKIIISSSEGISKIDYNEANASKSCLSLIGNLDSVATIVECTSIEIIAVGYQNGTIGIYSKKYSQELLQISEFSSYPILTIQFLFIELKIKDSKKKVKYFDECKFVASDAKGLLYFFDLSIDLYKPIERINPLQNYNNPKHITVNKLDHQYQIKINFFDINIQEIYINVLKYVEKDFKTIKQKNHDLLKNLMQNNY